MAVMNQEQAIGLDLYRTAMRRYGCEFLKDRYGLYFGGLSEIGSVTLLVDWVRRVAGELMLVRT